MKSTKISLDIQRSLTQIMSQVPIVHAIVDAIAQAGGRTLLVGGAVRDLFLERQTKDLDIEVHGVTPDNLEHLLGTFGPVSLVGKSFGVFRIAHLDIDWSLPRADSGGRKPQVVVDPHMPIKDACARRDVTINAMGIDLHTHELVDPFNGIADLKNKILRAPDPDLFVHDPLRLYRVMQFVSRFEMTPDDELNRLCKTMDISAVSIERIETEFEKLMLRSQRPSLGIRWLQQIGRLKEILPELHATIATQQSPQWHPEGHVFEHTMQAIDAAAQIPHDDSATHLQFMYAVLCHDLGKVVATQLRDDGTITSRGHAEAGVAIAKKMMKRITTKKDLIAGVVLLVNYHMHPIQFVKNGAKLPAYKRLANKLAPHATMQLLADVTIADKRGRNPDKYTPLTGEVDGVAEFLAQAEKAHVRESREEPVLCGRDIMDLVKPGPAMGRFLNAAYQIQLDEGITDKETLKKRVSKTKT